MTSLLQTIIIAGISILIGLGAGAFFAAQTDGNINETADKQEIVLLGNRIAEYEGQLAAKETTIKQFEHNEKMFVGIQTILDRLPPQEQSILVSQLEEVAMNSVITTDSDNPPFIVPKDSAKYGPTNNFDKQEKSVFYPLLNEKYSEYSVFENFEDIVYLPGLTLTEGTIVENNGVDADDGKINENSKGGKNYSVSVNNSIVFDFDESGIPHIPNYFGVVLTDYQCAQINDWYTTPIIYRVYGDGSSPIIEDSFSFGSKSGNISEDTFLGFFNKDGITSVEIQVDQPTCSRAKILQIDHIQYGMLR